MAMLAASPSVQPLRSQQPSFRGRPRPLDTSALLAHPAQSPLVLQPRSPPSGSLRGLFSGTSPWLVESGQFANFDPISAMPTIRSPTTSPTVRASAFSSPARADSPRRVRPRLDSPFAGIFDALRQHTAPVDEDEGGLRIPGIGDRRGSGPKTPSLFCDGSPQRMKENIFRLNPGPKEQPATPNTNKFYCRSPCEEYSFESPVRRPRDIPRGIPSPHTSKDLPGTPSRHFALAPMTPTGRPLHPSTPTTRPAYPTTPTGLHRHPTTPTTRPAYPTTPTGLHRHPSTPTTRQAYPSTPTGLHVNPTTPTGRAIYPTTPTGRGLTPSLAVRTPARVGWLEQGPRLRTPLAPNLRRDLEDLEEDVQDALEDASVHQLCSAFGRKHQCSEVHCLHEAVLHRHSGALRFLLDQGCDVEELCCGRTGRPLTPLQVCIGCPDLFFSLSDKQLDIVRALLEHGADPNRPFETRQQSGTALHFACQQVNVELAALLLRHGADPNVVDHRGQTPLHLAVIHASSQILTADAMELVELLVAHGSNPRAECHRGLKPLRYTQLPRVQQVLKKAETWWAARPVAWIRSRASEPGVFGSLLDDHLRHVVQFL